VSRLKPLASMIGRIVLIVFLVSACVQTRVMSDGDDGYDSKLAQAVRSATIQYRLVLWAAHDGYVQTTDYIPSFGTMYTNHARFEPQDLSAPTVLVYDLAGRLVACGYQYQNKADIPTILRSPQISGWYDIPRHVHYNIVVNGVTYYAQQPWSGDDQPTAPALIARKLMPPDGKLLFAFVHPAATAIIVWAWMPNSNGLFDAANPALP
jgi:hypothetical protein